MNKEFFILLGMLMVIGLGTAVIVFGHDDNRRKSPFEEVQHTVCLELHQKAVRYFIDRDYIEAENYLRRLLKISPEDRDVQRFYGRILIVTGKVLEAEKLYRKMLSVNPLDWGAQNNLGVTLLLRHQYEAALRELDRAARNDNARVFTEVNKEAANYAMELLRGNKKFIFVMNDVKPSQARNISIITLSALEIQDNKL